MLLCIVLALCLKNQAAGSVCLWLAVVLLQLQLQIVLSCCLWALPRILSATCRAAIQQEHITVVQRSVVCASGISDASHSDQTVTFLPNAGQR